MNQLDKQLFIRIWEENVRNVHRLYLDTLLINITETLLESTIAKGYDSDVSLTNLLHHLVDVLNNDSILCKILRKINPSTIQQLTHFVANEDYDTNKINQLLKLLDKSLKGNEFIIQMKEKLMSGSVMRMEYHFVISNLIRSLLLKFSTKYLETLPKKKLAEHFFEYNLKMIYKTVLTDGDIVLQATRFVDDVLNKLFLRIDHISNDNDSFPKDIFKSSRYWLSDCDYIVRLFYEFLLKCITNEEGTLNPDDVKKQVQPIIMKIMKKVFVNLMHWLLSDYMPYGQNRELYKKEYFAKYSNLIKERIRRTSYANFSLSLVDSGLLAIIETLWERNMDSIEREIAVREIEEFVLFINNEQQTSNQKKNYLSFDFSYELTKYITAIANRTVRHILDVMTYVHDESFNNLFLFHQLSHLKKTLSQEYDLLPESLLEEEFVPAINGLFEELTDEEKAMEVFFLLGNLDLKGRLINISENIVLYDSRKWNLCEGYEFDILYSLKTNSGEQFESKYSEYYTGKFSIFPNKNLEEIIVFKRNSARAMVNVMSHDPDKAIEKAESILKRMLSLLVFSSSNEYFYFKPQLTSKCAVRSLQTYILKMKAPEHYNSLEIDDKHEELLQEHNIMARGDLTENLDRALSWFNRAFWDPEQYSKFTSYWIALEQLIKPYARNTSLSEVISHLTVTWRDDMQNAISIHRRLNEIIEQIHSNPRLMGKLNDDDRFTDWKIKDYVILENLGKLKILAKGSDIEPLVNNLKKVIDRNKLGVYDKLRMLKTTRKFQIMLVYSKRKRIIHEGATNFDGLIHINKFLEDILRRAILNINEFQKIKKINPLTLELNRPFKNTNSNDLLSFNM